MYYNVLIFSCFLDLFLRIVGHEAARDLLGRQGDQVELDGGLVQAGGALPFAECIQRAAPVVLSGILETWWPGGCGYLFF